MTTTDMRHMEFLNEVAASDIEVLREKEATYKGSWKQRGGIGAFMMLARKWDRLENMLSTTGKFGGGDKDASPYDIFKWIECYVECDKRSGHGEIGTDGTALAEVRDMRRYLLLVEAEMMARGVVNKPLIAPVHIHRIEPVFDSVISGDKVHEKNRIPRSATDRDRALAAGHVDCRGDPLIAGDPCTWVTPDGTIEVHLVRVTSDDRPEVKDTAPGTMLARWKELRLDPTRLTETTTLEYEIHAGPCEINVPPGMLAEVRVYSASSSSLRRVPRYETEHVVYHRVGDVAVTKTDRAFDYGDGGCNPEQTPRINIKCECKSDGVIGITSLNVVRVEREDDGSLTAVTDFWPVTGGERLVPSTAHGSVEMRPNMDDGQHAALAPWVVGKSYAARKDIDQDLFDSFWNRRGGDTYVLEPHVLSSRIPRVLRDHYNSRGESWTLRPERIPRDTREFFPRLGREHNMKEHEEMAEWQQVLYTWSETKCKYELAEQNTAWTGED